MKRRKPAIDESHFVALLNKAALLVEQLGSGLYEISDDVDIFPSMVETIRLKYNFWSTQVKQYGSPGQNIVAPLLRAATKKLKDEDIRLQKLHSSCYMKCFASTQFRFPRELSLSFQRMIEVLENLPVLMKETEDVVRDIMITSISDTNHQHQHYDRFRDVDVDYDLDCDDQPVEFTDHRYLVSKPNRRPPVSGLPFYADKRYVPLSSPILEIRKLLEKKDGPQLVVLQGGPGTGKSSLARHLALHYQNKQAYYPGNMQHFADGVFYMSCDGGVDIEAKQLEFMQVLNYPLHLLVTSGEGQQISDRGIHKKLVEYMEEMKALVFLDDMEDYDLLLHLIVPSSSVKYIVTSELELEFENSVCFTMPPLRIEDARKILAQYIDFPDFIPAKLKDVVDAIIIATGANPLALVSLSLAVSSGSSLATDSKVWMDVERNLRMLLDDDADGLITLGQQYPRHVTCSMVLTLDYIPQGAKIILFALAAFDDLPIPEVLVILLIRCTIGDAFNFSFWKDFLCSKGLIHQQQSTVPWSNQPQTTLRLHGIRKHCVRITSADEIELLISTLLDQLDSFQEDIINSDAALMTALCVVYGEGELAVRAASKLSFSNCSHIGSLILTWLTPFVSLLGDTANLPKDRSIADPKQTSSTHILAKQVILDLIRNLNPENSITGLLKNAESAVTTCWALALHALDKPPLIVSELIIRELVTLLEEDSPPKTQLFAAWALTNITLLEDKQYNLVSFPGYLEAFVRLLGYDSQPEAQTLAAFALMVMAEAEENWIAIGSFSDAVSGLVALLGMHSRTDTQVHAACALASLTGDRENKLKVAEFPGALQELVGLLAKEMSPAIQSKAAWALANMAEAEENKPTIAAVPGAVGALVRLLKLDETVDDNAPDVQSTKALCNLNAAWALANLSDAGCNKESIASYPGALDSLVRLLKEDVNPQTRCSAAWTLVHLAEAPEPKIKLMIAKIPGALEGLVGLFETYSEQNQGDMQQEATSAWRNLSASWALGSLADAEENKKLVANCPGALESLVCLLGGANHLTPHLEGRAAWAIANLAASPANQEMILAFPGALRGLVALLPKSNVFTQSNALRAVAHLVEAKGNRVQVARFPGILDSLVTLLKPEVSLYTQNNAARALATMATARENQIAIAKYPGALEGFVRLLSKDGSPALQTNGAWALANLAEDSMNKLEIALFPGAIERLLRLLDSDVDPGVQAVAARTLVQIDARTNNRLILASAEAYRSRAVINIEMGNYKQALLDLDRAHTLQPENAYTLSWRRFVRATLEDYEGALQDANTAIELQPHKQFHWQERGILKGMMRDLQGALEDLTTGLEYNPNDYESLKHRDLFVTSWKITWELAKMQRKLVPINRHS